MKDPHLWRNCKRCILLEMVGRAMSNKRENSSQVGAWVEGIHRDSGGGGGGFRAKEHCSKGWAY